MDDAGSLLGRLAVHYQLITQEQLQQLVAYVRRHGNAVRFGEAMVRSGAITQEQLTWLLQKQEVYLARQKAQQAAQAAAPAPAQGADDDAPTAVVAAPVQPAPVQPPRPAAAPQPVAAQAAVPQAAPQAARPSAEPVAPGAPAVVKMETPARAAAPPMQEVAQAAGQRTLDRLLAGAVQRGASDVHIHTGAPTLIRRNGHLSALTQKVVDRAAAEQVIYEILTPEQRERFEETNDLDFAYVVPGVGRFRSSVYRQQRGIDAVFRMIPAEPPTLESLGLPPILAKFTNYHQGLVLCTGPTGCGKTSTLAALVNLINGDRADHILTVEDPIEYVHTPKRCSVNQRQVKKHTESFARALRAALREDPDVIAIGEMRDLETIQLAISAAETGHLVIGTLHTSNAQRTINRIMGVFPPEQQSQIRTMVSESLRAIISQRLVATADGQRRVPALEILVTTPAVSNLIRDEKVFQLRSVMQTGKNVGQLLLDDSLKDLVQAGTITKEEARLHAENPALFGA